MKMKTWTRLATRFGIAAIAGSVWVMSAPASVIYWEEDFEGYSVNADIRNTGGWGTVNFSRTHVEQDATDPVNPSKFVRFEDGAVSNRAITRPLGEAVSDARITMDLFNISGTASTISLWFRGGSVGEEGEGGTGDVRMYWHSSRNISIWAQGEGVTQDTQTFTAVYEMNTWYRVFLDLSYSEADPAASTYTLQVYELQDAEQGTLGSRIAHVEDAPAAGMKTFTQLSVFSAGSATANFKMDNLVAVTLTCEATEGAERRESVDRREMLLDVFARETPTVAAAAIAEALGDESSFVRRTAAHLLARLGRPAEAELGTALRHGDFEVRRIALEGLADADALADHLDAAIRDDHPVVQRSLMLAIERLLRRGGAGAETLAERLARSYADVSPAARAAILEIICEMTPVPEGAGRLLREAMADPSAAVRQSAFDVLLRRDDGALSFSENEVFSAAAEDASMAIREMAFQRWWEQPEADSPVPRDPGRVTAYPLPADGWRFRTDPERVGHGEGWFETEFNDGEWKEIGIEKAWHHFTGDRYIGVAWYRRSVEAPPLSAGERLLLRFEGVDEMAWAWINGTYVGQQNLGPIGYNLAFDLDITAAVRAGEENLVAIRVKNTIGAGGIWRPVSFRVVKAKPSAPEAP